MLERTAAGLEPCCLQRALPSTASLASRRKLHSGFWQHGAAAIELSQLWPSPFQDSIEPAASTPSRRIAEGLAASTFLLDFLYPRGTANLLRRRSPGVLQRRENSQQCFAQPGPRNYASSAPTAERSQVGLRLFEDQTRENMPQEQHPNRTANIGNTTGWDNKHKPAPGDVVYGQASSTSYANAGSRPDLIRQLIANEDTEYFDAVWDLYCQLEGDLKMTLRTEVITYLWRSSNDADAERILGLFSQMDIESWTQVTLSAAVAADLRLGNVPRALERFKLSLAERRMVGGLDQILHYAFRKSDWEMVKDVWSSYHLAYTAHGIRCGELRELKTVPNLGALVLQLRDDIALQVDGSSLGNRVSGLDVLLKKAARRALLQGGNPREALGLLEIVGQGKWYKIYLTQEVQNGRLEGLPEVYRVLRQLPEGNVRPRVLCAMFDCFYPHDVEGLEQVYEDYHRSGGRLDRLGFQKFLKFYASRGDIKSLRRMWDSYVTSYGHMNVLQEAGTFNHLLNAYANRGSIDEVRQLLDEMVHKHGVTPSPVSWNILLKTYVQLNLYDEAIDLFDDICKTGQPDAFTFATIMSMISKRGDLDLTLELFSRASSMGIQIGTHLISAVVEAYCQNDRLHQARIACVDATQRKIPGDPTPMWNSLLLHHVWRRDLNRVYEILSLMTTHQVQWTAATYNLLLQGLVLCKQTHHAYRILQVVVTEKSFHLNSEHFAIVMGGALRSDEPRLVNSLRILMREAGLPTTMDTLTLLLESMFKKQSRRRENRQHGVGKETTQQMGKNFTYYYRRLLKASQKDALLDPERRLVMHQGMGDVELLHRNSKVMSRAISLLAQLGDFTSVDQLIRLYSSIYPDSGTDEKSFPISVLSSLLLAEFMEQKYEKAKQTWEVIWQKALKLGRPASYKGEGVLPRHQYDLSTPLNTMQKILAEEKKPAPLFHLVEKVTSAGFKLDSMNWNYLVQALANMGCWKEAFELCEDKLMPHWTGWYLRRQKSHMKWNLPLEQRRLRSGPRYLRPTSYTLIMVAKEYMKAEQVSPWSSEAAAKIKRINKTCPMLVHAIKSMIYSGIGVERNLSLSTDFYQRTPENATGLALEELLDEEPVSKELPSEADLMKIYEDQLRSLRLRSKMPSSKEPTTEQPIL